MEFNIQGNGSAVAVLALLAALCSTLQHLQQLCGQTENARQ
jgi:hypothetical protein